MAKPHLREGRRSLGYELGHDCDRGSQAAHPIVVPAPPSPEARTAPAGDFKGTARTAIHLSLD